MSSSKHLSTNFQFVLNNTNQLWNNHNYKHSYSLQLLNNLLYLLSNWLSQTCHFCRIQLLTYKKNKMLLTKKSNSPASFILPKKWWLHRSLNQKTYWCLIPAKTQDKSMVTHPASWTTMNLNFSKKANMSDFHFTFTMRFR